MSADPDPYEPPEHRPEVEAVRDFTPISDWRIRLVFLTPTAIYLVGAVVLRIFLSLSGHRLGKIDSAIAWIAFGMMALPASIYTANYFRRRDQNSFPTMIFMVFIHLVLHAFIAYGAAMILVMFS